MPKKLAGIETGGTSCRVAIAIDRPDNIIAQERFPTTDNPSETFDNIVAWLKKHDFDCIGVACFGPVDLNRSSPTFGYVTSTPKPGWTNFDVLSPLKAAFPAVAESIRFETDVNAPAMAELKMKQSKNTKISSCAYVTVGTGVGVGLVIDNQCVHGLVHPEVGHIPVRLTAADQLASFAGTCPFHGPCLEGLVASGALSSRAGVPATDLKSLADDHPVWAAAAHYLAQLCVTLTLTTSVEVIVLGGGVMSRPSLFPAIRTEYLKLLNGYIVHSSLKETNIDRYIVPSEFGGDAGIIGALSLHS